jgi:hypothetical protein
LQLLVAVTRHWALTQGEQIQGTQALLMIADGDRIGTINALSRSGSETGIWD